MKVEVFWGAQTLRGLRQPEEVGHKIRGSLKGVPGDLWDAQPLRDLWQAEEAGPES